MISKEKKMKKEYLKPEAEYLELYAEEDLADIGGDGNMSGGLGDGDMEDGWV